MDFTPGTAIAITSTTDPYRVRIHDKDRSFLEECPVIAWAVVNVSDDEDLTIKTEVQPVFLYSDGTPLVTQEFVDAYGPHVITIHPA
ncbi:hypothetical protein [Nonomuraea sp. NPDC003754]